MSSISTTRAQVLIIVFSPCMYRTLRPVVPKISYWIVLVVSYSGQRDHTSFQRCMDCASGPMLCIVYSHYMAPLVMQQHMHVNMHAVILKVL